MALEKQNRNDINPMYASKLFSRLPIEKEEVQKYPLENGQLITPNNYINHTQKGEWKLFNKKGQLIRIEEWSNRKFNGDRSLSDKAYKKLTPICFKSFPLCLNQKL